MKSNSRWMSATITIAAIQLRILASLIAIVLLSSATRAAQLPGSLSGPVLGYVFDRNAATVRAVRGIPGSATVGEPLDLGFGVSQVLPLDERRVIASTDASGDLLLVTLDGAQISTLAISGVPAKPARSTTSLQRTSAAFYDSAAQQVHIAAGLPREPRHVATFQLDRPLTQMAVSDDGTLLVYAVTEPEGEAIYALAASSSGPRFLTSTVSVSGIAITRSGDAIVTDRGANEVFAIRDAAGGAVRHLLVDISNGVSSPLAVAVSSGNRIYVANTGSVIVLDSDGRFLRSLRCSCSVSALYGLRDSLFRLTEGITKTIFLLDASSAEERILFVPPPLK